MQRINQNQVQRKYSPSLYDSDGRSKLLSSTSWFWQQNKIIPCSAGVPLNDRGFRYGQHLFETLAIRSGKILFFEEHWEQLMIAAQRHHFPINDSWHRGVSQFLRQNAWHDGLLRTFLTAGEGSPCSPIVAPNLFLFWEEVHFPSDAKLREGIEMISLNHPIGTTSWGEKTGNYWEHLSALETVHQAGAEEGLIFDQNGFLISATMANVILWLDTGRVVTPARARGARHGVMLAQVRQQYPEMIQADVTRGDLKKIVSMVVTNSRMGMMPVSRLDGKELRINSSLNDQLFFQGKTS